jgi:outer membrane lipoprotein-sorting protein
MHIRFVPVLGLLGLAASGAHAAELPFLASQSEYSATRIIETHEGDFEQKVNWTPDKVRTETSIGGVALLNIVRDDLGVMWIANPMLGRCLEQPVESIDEMTQLGGQYTADEVTYKELGKETVDGLATTKYEVSADDTEIGPHKAYMWTTAENILVRMEMETVAEGTELKFTMRLVELELGAQDDALFESPGDCVSLEELGQP